LNYDNVEEEDSRLYAYEVLLLDSSNLANTSGQRWAWNIETSISLWKSYFTPLEFFYFFKFNDNFTHFVFFSLISMWNLLFFNNNLCTKVSKVLFELISIVVIITKKKDHDI